MRPLLGDSDSSYILNTLIWRFRFTTCLKHAPSFAIPVHHISSAVPVHHVYLKRAPSFGDSGSSYILNRPLFRDSGSSYRIYHISMTRPSFGDSAILHMPPRSAIPAQHLSETGPLIWRFGFIIYLKHVPHLATRPLIWRIVLASPVHHIS